MLSVNFEYPVSMNQMCRVIATCKSVVGSQFVEGLSLTFLNEDDIRVHVPYDKDMFEDIESEAVYMLAEQYYNPELTFDEVH